MLSKTRQHAPERAAGRLAELHRAASERRVGRAIRARRDLASPRAGGRVWLNGREVGGADPRYTHLETSHD
jgi:hypothetical protein